jgi:uncharacterized protein YkwD
MADKKTASKKSSVRRKPKAKQSGIRSLQSRFNLKFLLIFVVLFAVIGGVVIFMTRAESSDQLLLSKEFVRPASVTKDPNDTSGSSVKRNYQDLSFQVYSSGQLVCGNPADPDVVTTTSLNNGQLKALQKQIASTGLSSQPDGVVLGKDEVLLGDNVTTITYLLNGQQKSLITTADNPKTEIVSRITALGENACKQAVTKLNRKDAPVPAQKKINKNKYNSDTVGKVTSYLRNQFAPKAEAASSYSVEAENVQYQTLEAVRSYLRMPQMRHDFCEAITARIWSNAMDVYNNMAHSSLANFHTQYCGYSWSTLGENIGITTCSNSDSATNCSKRLFTAFSNSTHHRDNLLGGKDAAGRPLNFNAWGVGVVRDTTRQQLWITHEFMRQ